MSRFVAFLRAINVGGRTVTMDRLRGCFERCGLEGVETFLASGNVIFETRSSAPAALERKIEAKLAAELGYEVAAFTRTLAEVEAVARYDPFPGVRIDKPTSLNVGFLAAALDEQRARMLMGFKTATDDFHAYGREIYWLCRIRQSDSAFTNAKFERAAGVRATFRGVLTIVRLAARYGEGR